MPGNLFCQWNMRLRRRMSPAVRTLLKIQKMKEMANPFFQLNLKDAARPIPNRQKVQTWNTSTWLRKAAAFDRASIRGKKTGSPVDVWSTDSRPEMSENRSPLPSSLSTRLAWRREEKTFR